MGFTANVVDGNIILAAWGNEIRDRTRQVFATKAELDAQWSTAPDGSSAITLDTHATWEKKASGWVAAGPPAWYGTLGSQFGLTTSFTPFNIITVTQSPGQYLVLATVYAQLGAAGSVDALVIADGTGISAQSHIVLGANQGATMTMFGWVTAFDNAGHQFGISAKASVAANVKDFSVAVLRVENRSG